jgi:hypothetical protein
METTKPLTLWFEVFLNVTGCERKTGLLLIDTFERLFNPPTERPPGDCSGGLFSEQIGLTYYQND